MAKQPTITEKYNNLEALVKKTVEFAYAEGYHEDLCDTGKDMLQALAIATSADITFFTDNIYLDLSPAKPMPSALYTQFLEDVNSGNIYSTKDFSAKYGEYLTVELAE